MAETEIFGRKINTDNITFNQKIIAGAIVALLVLGGIGYYQVYPQWEELQVLNDEIVKQEEDIETKEMQVKKLPELKRKLKKIEGRLAILRRKIPTSPNVAALMLDLENITENEALYGNGAFLNSFRPSGLVSASLPASMQDAAGSETAKQLKQLPVSIKISNISYPDFIKLLTDYESYERTLSFENLSLIPVENDESLYTPVNVTFKVKAFLLDGGGK